MKMGIAGMTILFLTSTRKAGRVTRFTCLVDATSDTERKERSDNWQVASFICIRIEVWRKLVPSPISDPIHQTKKQ